MAHWATSPLDRNQVTLFAPTLDDSVCDAHPVRLFGETLEALDFSTWESMYVRVIGQPPIHPRVLAGCILYGLSLGIRTSRRLEDAAINRLDFMWLLEGHTPDHSTICNFRTQFGPQIKDLFRQVGRVAIGMGLISLNQVMLDGTDLKANNSRYATNRQTSLQQKLDVLDCQIERLLAEADAADVADQQLFGDASPAKLPKPLRALKDRQERLRQAMKNLAALEKDRGPTPKDTTKETGKDSSPDTGNDTGNEKAKGKARKAPAIPTTDPDSRVLPTKTGGYAPEYTAVLATDAEHGFIVDVQVLIGNDEASTVLPAVQNIEQNFGRKPGEVTADTGFNTGANLAGLAQQKVEALMPPRQEVDASAAQRPDPTQPVPEADQARLPINPQNKVLDRSAFTYDAATDQYHCPMGRPMPYTEDKPYNRDGKKGTYKVYQSLDCSGCPLASRCLAGQSPTRRVCRDEHEPLREAMAKRLASEAGRERYKKRAAVAEGAFAALKSRMNFRQFVLRGIEKVRIELDWATTAFNLTKLARLTAL